MKLVKYKGTEGYYMSDIKKVLNTEMYEHFLKFMRGQTIPVISRKGKENLNLIYKYDYERFINMLVYQTVLPKNRLYKLPYL